MEKNLSFDGIVLKFNKQAMDFLHAGALDKALKHLVDAEKILKEKNIAKNSGL
jgi:hypothetical protein